MKKRPNPNLKLGRESYRNNKERGENPHTKGSEDFKAWDRGWCAEWRDNQ